VDALVELLPARDAEFYYYNWDTFARPEQQPPPGDWAVWLIKSGRGWGKTRTGASWVHKRAMEFPNRWIAMIARTPADARDYMIEGPGGLLRNTHPKERPNYEPSKRRITWPNGSWATIYSDDEPDQTRGFSGDTAWLDEFAKFKNPIEVWDNLQFGMRERSNDRPRQLITTTPRPLQILRDIETRPTTRTVTGSSYDNRDNLDDTWFAQLHRYEGTRIGRQEIHGEILEDMAGALWTRSMIETYRVREPVVMRRVVVAIDPSASSGEESDEAGVICVGRGVDDHAYVLADGSERMSPTQWANRAVLLYERHQADRIIAEVNNGGEMVEATLRIVSPSVPFRAVHASRGKVIRAEPVSALYERGLVHHVGGFPALEDQMCAFTTDFDRKAQGYSPDRVDALVWAMTDLMIDQMAGMGVFEYWRRLAGGEEPKVLAPGALEDKLAAMSARYGGMADETKLPSGAPNFGFEFGLSVQAKGAIKLVALKPPVGTTTVYGMSGKIYTPERGRIEVPEEDVHGLLTQGFERLA
jgi:predicted phage terminase large subunit-like protein